MGEDTMKKVNIYLSGVLFVLCLAFLAQGAFAAGEPSVELLSPVRGEEVPFGAVPVVAISIFDLEGDTDISTVELKIDGTEVTEQANVSALLVTYSFEGAATGRHTIEFTIEDRAGNGAALESFFTVLGEPQREKKLTANGSIKVGAEYDREASQSAVGLIDANVYGRLSDSVDYSANVKLTNEEASDGQRVSTYRLDLKSPFGIAVLGDATPNFGTYTINGQSVFGVHLQPQFGAVFGIELLYGQLLRPVEDPANEAFRRMAYGGKFKIGRDPQKFLWGLTFLKVKDKMHSITPTTVTPKDNIILGTDFSFGLFKNVLSLKLEANESLLNDDITGGPGEFTDYNLPFDPETWEWLFVFNDKMIPLVPNGLSSLAARAAIKAGPIGGNTLNAEVSYVGPSYNSLANPAIDSDRAGVRAWDTMWLFKKKVYLNLAAQYYQNSLAGSVETYTTKTAGFAGSTYVYPSDYLTFNAGVDFLRSNNNAAVPADLIDTTNITVNGGVTRELEVLNTNSSVYLNGSATLFTDKATPSNDEDIYSSRLGFISYFTGKPLDTKAVVGFDFGDADSVYIQGKAGYRFLKDESLYAFADAVYETGPEQLDFKLGADYEAPFGIGFEADFEYIDSPVSSDVILSAYATKKF